MTTRNYRPIANLHNSQITTLPANPFSECCVFTNHTLATASNSGDPAGSRTEILFSQPPVQITTEVTDSESYIMTDGQPASLAWNKAPVWGLRPEFYYCQKVEGLLLWGALSD
jgi:hypothetical protein